LSLRNPLLHIVHLAIDFLLNQVYSAVCTMIANVLNI